MKASKELVFLSNKSINAVPLTTSKVIADFTGIGHKKIKAAINKHKKAFESFGLLVPYESESTGGRPEESIYLNEQQATLLITFLKNTEAVVNFKVALVKAFYKMRKELTERLIAKQELKPVQKTLAEVIDTKIPDSPHKKFAFKQFTDLAYKNALGRTAAQLRKERGANSRAIASDFLSTGELNQVRIAENHIIALIDMGYIYHEIKALTAKSKAKLSA
ncbi:MAG: Phage regulatory protein Rha (Phage_pRha) [Firmicutes bacterium ADurb.Bin193]|nr:Rha family transcriptional regulator [Clostridiaceae bacterium]OQB13222.1 MAG: Phage regulatory protein Rha (Phage_pRha) [Firmicutes bacterium ADurb.Bin193]